MRKQKRVDFISDCSPDSICMMNWSTCFLCRGITGCCNPITARLLTDAFMRVMRCAWYSEVVLNPDLCIQTLKIVHGSMNYVIEVS